MPDQCKACMPRVSSVVVDDGLSSLMSRFRHISSAFELGHSYPLVRVVLICMVHQLQSETGRVSRRDDTHLVSPAMNDPPFPDVRIRSLHRPPSEMLSQLLKDKRLSRLI